MAMFLLRADAKALFIGDVSIKGRHGRGNIHNLDSGQN